MIEEITQRIKSLPPLPKSFIKINQIRNSSNGSVSELIDVVLQDPMLSANILKIANSPLYSFSREINSISQAVSLFGMATIKRFALASAVKRNFKIDLTPYDISLNDFSRISNLQSALMFQWYSKVDRTKLEILVPAAFLDGVGQVVVASQVISDEKLDEFRNDILNSELVEEVEKKFYEMANEEVSAEIFNEWKLEPLISEVIRGSLDPKNCSDDIKDYAYALRIVREAVNIKEQFTENSINKALKLIDEVGLDRDVFLSVVKHLSDNSN